MQKNPSDKGWDDNMTKKVKSQIFIFMAIILILSSIAYLFFYKNSTETFKNNGIDSSNTLIDISPFKDKVIATKEEDLPPKEELNGYGLRVFDENGNMIKNNSISINQNAKDMKLYISLASANNFSDKIGFYIFIDEVMQNFIVDNDNQYTNFYSHNIENYSLVNVPVVFTPELNVDREKHTLWVVMVHSLNEKPSETHHIPYFVSTIKFNLDISKEKNNLIEYDNDVEYGSISKKYKEVKQQKSFRAAISFNGSQSLYQEPVLTIENGTKELSFQAVNEIGEYATFFFVDQNRVSVNKKDALLWAIQSKDEMLDARVELDNLLNDGSEIYTLTVPLDKSIDIFDINESAKILVKRK